MVDVVILAPSSTSLLARLAMLAETAGHHAERVGDLLVVRGHRLALDEFARLCASTVPATEAASTRFLFLDVDPAEVRGIDVLAAALGAESLATLAAREAHGRLLDALVVGDGAHALYQPVTDLRSGRTSGFEALLRLDHDGRAVPPLEVFAAATEAGRLASTDAAARAVAVAGAAGWIGPRTLYVNLQPSAVLHPRDFDATDDAVADAGLQRRQVVFEARLDADRQHVVRVLEHLRARGYGVGLDDADVDATRLIADLRPDTVKIGRALVKELPGLQARSAVSTVVGAAHEVGAAVVATGIETAAQMDAVVFVGVDHAQGWQVGQPMRAPTARTAA